MRAFHVVALLMAVAGAAAPAAAQPAIDALLDRPIATVVVVADGHDLADPAVLALIDTRAGQPLDMAAVRRTLHALAALERFDDITVEATDTPAGLALRYVVSRVRQIDAIDFRGDRGVSAGTLRQALTERYGREPAPGRGPEMVSTLVEALVAAGFLDAAVTYRIAERGGTAATLIFDVRAGPRFRIGLVKVAGNPAGDDARLLERLRATQGREWRASEMARRVEAEIQRLRAQGHYEARLTVTPTRQPGEPRVDLVVTVDAGPLVDLVFEGDPLPRSRLDELVPIRREGSVDEDLLEDSRRRVEEFLRNEGYWQASADYRRSETDGRLRIVFGVHRGPVYEVGRVEVHGVVEAPLAEVDALVLSRQGRPFVETRLDADVAAIRQFYQARGHAGVRVTRTIDEVAGTAAGAPRRVDLAITVEEGPIARVGTIVLEGPRALDEATVRTAMRLAPDGPFFAPALEADRAAIELLYLNRGYPDAVVRAAASPAADGTRVDLTYGIDEGQPAIVDHVIVTGNARTNAATILREAQIAAGRAVGLGDLEAAQRRIAALGLFRRVRIDTLRDAATGVVDVVIAVEENAATTLGYGAGLEGGRRLRREDVTGAAVERLEFAPRGFFEVGRRNLWGKNRSVNLFARASLRQAPGSVGDPAPGGFGLYEYRVIASFREPHAFGGGADAGVSALIEQAIRSSFSYRRRSVNADLTRRTARGLTLIARYSYGDTNVYEQRYGPSDKPLIDRLFPQVTLSTLAGVLARDTRDDAIDPTRGTVIGIEGDLATRTLGSEVGYVKTFAQGFLYRRVPGTRLVVAGGLRLGLATGFSRQVPRVDDQGRPVLDPDGQPLIDTVRDLPASERFYAGGDSTVRGFALDRLGDRDTIDVDGFPTGGDAVIIANAELRFPVTRTLGGVAFLDGGNVFARMRQMDLGRVRGAAGFGVRYKSPIGPLRFDVGFKLDPRILGNGRRERRYALHISIGQAF